MQVDENLKLLMATAATAVAKWLMTQEVPPDGETRKQRRVRVMQSFGGIAAGILCGYFGHTWMIRNVDVFTADDKVLVAIMLTLTGEHLFRTISTKAPQILVRVLGFREPDK